MDIRSRPFDRVDLAKLTNDKLLQKQLENLALDTSQTIPESMADIEATADQALDIATTSRAQAYILVAATPTLPNARGIGLGPGLSGSDSGPGLPYTISLQAFLQSLAALVGNGIVVKTLAGAQLRTIQAGSSRIAVANGDGTTGNPAIDIDEPSLNLANMGGTLGVAHGGTGVTVLSSFSAHNNGVNQSIPNSAFTLLSMSAELFDLNSNFAASAWTPPAGRPVLLTGSVSISMAAAGAVSVAIFKNGAQFRSGIVTQAAIGNAPSVTVSCIDVPNGTDVYDLRAIQTSGAAQNTSGLAPLTWFMGSML